MPDYEILFNCFILCGTALRPKCYQSSDEMPFVPGICLCSIFHFSRQQWCIQNSSTDASSFHLYPQTFQRSFYLASILVICFYFPYKLAQLKVHHGTGGKEQKLEWKTKKHKLKDTGEHGMKTHGAERQEVEGKGAERQKEKDHNAKGQRTEGHCQRMAQRSSWLLRNAWLFSWKWWQPMTMHHSAHGAPLLLLQGTSGDKRCMTHPTWSRQPQWHSLREE